ncbi:hypothetical protein POSPLADRAFT_1153063 [Postia placenta MAD-698-R-SB12]|uniref:MYND-type domain-containing protein n=1 Tax=Postia placenta MAD-698-R-SB12 TaxID=670580 RepID=A0A1X6MQN4_9APHY|nr:hypothetical protein POSPLADRAFT_1153063 [Postia placenta MAD-698-R-SB12]OSX58701.1 hypothetical protein POSPLADRAFT_1153063 [Postia placenta MAD-698-R-SB12]
MSHTLYWPGIVYFYPIGNTSAVDLLRDTPPAEDTHLLLLGCGDPRNVLYTIFTDRNPGARVLDFTCCDIEPAVIARNILLLTLVADRGPCTGAIWNIFFHIYLDHDSHRLLVEQLKNLIARSSSIERWRASVYGSFIKISSRYTLMEVRRHWELYRDMHHLPSSRIVGIRKAFAEKMTRPTRVKVSLSSARSAAPLLLEAAQTMSAQFNHFWTTGVTHTNSADIAAATLINPTFVYSLAGEGCAVHYGTDPLIPFHFAPIFGNAHVSTECSIDGLVRAAKDEFTAWCSAYQAAISSTAPPVIRYFLGEAIAVCRALNGFLASGIILTDIPVAQWNTELIHLEETEYTGGCAPSTFHVIDTSNLVDHLGLLNVFVSTIPLLVAAHGVLYTETLIAERLISDKPDPAKAFTESLYADGTLLGLLLNLHPVGYVSGFTSRCNTSEILLRRAAGGGRSQFYQPVTWKYPYYASSNTVDSGNTVPVFDPSQLPIFFYNMYQRMYEREDGATFWKLNKKPPHDATADSNLLHYTRESFVLLLKLIQQRIATPDAIWMEVMDKFVTLLETNKSMMVDKNNLQELCCQLHRHGLYTPSFMKNTPPIAGPFSQWSGIPLLVRIILVVPRDCIAAIEPSLADIGTPILQCDIWGKYYHNLFSSVHAAFGKLVIRRSPIDPQITIVRDSPIPDTSNPLVLSFIAPSSLLRVEPMRDVRVCVSLRSTAINAKLISKLGLMLTVFSAPLLDTSAVHILPWNGQTTQSSFGPWTTRASIEDSHHVAVTLDKSNHSILNLSRKVEVEGEKARCRFKNGDMPTISHTSPNAMRLSLGDFVREVVFPIPIVSTNNRLRLARKSSYIEVVVLPSKPLNAHNVQFGPFPIVLDAEGRLHLWNIHRVSLPSLPALTHNVPRRHERWIYQHASTMFNAVGKPFAFKLAQGRSTMDNLKETILGILSRASGDSNNAPGRIFLLRDKTTKEYDLVLFIPTLRFDLSSHTILCDGFVLPVTDTLLSEVAPLLSKLATVEAICVAHVNTEELRAWKYLLPALAERCRRAWDHGEQCEYRAHNKIPLSLERYSDPLCSCGRGKETEGVRGIENWAPFLPHSTRIALSPLFSVPYDGDALKDPHESCCGCGGEGKPKLLLCSGCKMANYCSRECQKENWKSHRSACKLANTSPN